MQSEPCQHQLNTVICLYALRFYAEIREAIRDNFIACIVPFSASFLIKAGGRVKWGENSGHRQVSRLHWIYWQSFLFSTIYFPVPLDSWQELNLIFKQISPLELYKMYGNRRGEYACWAWRLKMANRQFCLWTFWYTLGGRKYNQSKAQAKGWIQMQLFWSSYIHRRDVLTE